MTALIFLVGCGGSSSSGSSGGGGGGVTPPQQDVSMVLSTPYTVYPGNKIVKNSEDALLSIGHVDYTNESTVTLLAGSATIIRNP